MKIVFMKPWEGVIFSAILWVATQGYAVDYFVDAVHGNDANAGTNQATAKATIQSGVDACSDGDIMWVSDGTYDVSNEVTVGKAIRIESLNGPAATIVDGGGSNRCFNLGEAACTLGGLTITNGYAPGNGGGIYCSSTTPVITNCVVRGNSAYLGGGMFYGTANHCTFAGNSAGYGGGMRAGTANNCVFTGNSANYGGGMQHSTVINCTFTGNSATYDGGGMYNGSANNCIAWYNDAVTSGDNMYDTSAAYTCSPDVTHGDNGCITNVPMLASSSHLSARSPCIGSGSTNDLSGTDIDGEAWKNPPSIGCDEFSETVSGAIELGFVSLPAQCAAEGTLTIQLIIDGAVSASTLSFGDGQMVSNVFRGATHQWSSAGEYDLVLSAFNLDYPEGLSVTQRISVVSAADAAVYVAPGGNDELDGRSWATAKATIQAGVDEQTCYGGTVWLMDGIYSVTSEVVVSSEIIIQSLNGPETTIVDGGGSNRCFNLGSTACTLGGLTIMNGFTSGDGGGIYCSSSAPVATNCVISGNSAMDGGGMYDGMALNCSFTENSASYGGGKRYGTASHCSFTENSAHDGGGMHSGTANSCTFTGNRARDTMLSYNSGGGMFSGTANSCTFTWNTASYGGGMNSGIANHCTFTGNSASYEGGGMRFGTANHCTFTGNSANYGGALHGGTANGCSFTENAARSRGGAMYSGTANHCNFTGNSATYDGGGMGYYRYLGSGPPGMANNCTFTANSAGRGGGGINEGTANNCTFTGNSASSGGGMYYSTANNCTFTGNSASSGGGMYYGTANNCIVWYNTASTAENDLYSTTAKRTCSPDVTQGWNGCFTNAPVFMNRAAGDFRLAFASPCIDAGANANASGSVDLDGNPRIVNGRVDVGAYEYNGALYDSDADGLIDDLELGIGSSPINANTDGDAMTDYEEYIAGTGAADPDDVFQIDWASDSNVFFESSSDRYYTLYYCTNLAEGAWIPSGPGRMGTGGEDSMNTNPNLPAGYYKLEVALP